jgi:hypothetical protein
MSEKIQQTHTERDAFVSIRQSSMHQVRNHLEGGSFIAIIRNRQTFPDERPTTEE